MSFEARGDVPVWDKEHQRFSFAVCRPSTRSATSRRSIHCGGLTPDHRALDKFAAAFAAQFPSDLPLLYLYPTVEGGLRLEWPVHGKEASLETALPLGPAYWHAYAGCGADEAAELPPSPNMIAAVAGRLRTLVEALARRPTCCGIAKSTRAG